MQYLSPREQMVSYLFRFVLLAAAMVPFTFAAEFFPLKPGNSWKYREAATGQTFTVQVGTPALIGDRIYYSLNGYVTRSLFVRMDQETNQLVYLDEEREIDLPLTSFAPFERGWWAAPFRICDQEGQTQQTRGTHDGPAGPFHNVLEIRYRSFGCADAGVESEQYVENIGMVRRVTGSIAGPRQFELIQAHVGNIRIDALKTGRFSISVDYKPDRLAATLRLETNSEHALKLLFNSGQEYELVLRDIDGNVIWRWSDGQAFPQVFHERTIVGEWSVTVSVPRPISIETKVGVYTLQAWLTTAGDSPQFAVTVPLTITSNPVP